MNIEAVKNIAKIKSISINIRKQVGFSISFNQVYILYIYVPIPLTSRPHHLSFLKPLIASESSSGFSHL